MARIILNEIRIKKKLNSVLKQPRYEKFAFNAANFRFRVGVIETLKSFDEHVVTKELKAGAKAEDSVLGYGNLAAFLGLPDSENSVAEVREYLREQLNNAMSENARFYQDKKGVVYEFKISAPSLKQIYEAFPPPPDSYGRSWIKVIEEGLGNFSYFVFRLAGLPNSRSGTGLQRKKKRKWIQVANSSPKINWIKDVMETFRGFFR